MNQNISFNMSNDVSGIVSASIIRYIRTHLGDIGLNAFFKEINVGAAQAASLESPTTWLTYDEASQLFKAARKIIGDPEVGRKIGEAHLFPHEPTGVADLVVSISSVGEALRNISGILPKYSTVTTSTALEVGDAHAIVRIKTNGGIHADYQMCLFYQGILSQFPVIFGLVPAILTETECQARGGRHCVYTIGWQEHQWSNFVDDKLSLYSMAWDEEQVAEEQSQLNLTPEDENRLLKEQVESLTSRLDAVYSTAAELLESDDLDSILRRITQRAANAVNAPKYLLVAKTSLDINFRIQWHGLLESEANTIARQIVNGTFDESDPSKMMVKISSSRHDYGYLAALLPDTMKFLEHDKRTLLVYANYAAVALDVATSLSETRLSDATSKALLDFGNSLATIKKKDEVAEILAQTIPSVLDAAGVVVLGYDKENDEFVEITRCFDANIADKIPSELVKFPPELILNLKTTLLSGEPSSISVEKGSHYMSNNFAIWNIDNLLYYPLVSSQRDTLGIVICGFNSATHKNTGQDVLTKERFKGLCSQAATAFENTLLLEQISHMAWHDPLTGLPNRRLFEDRLKQDITRTSRNREPVTVFYVDLDKFKQVNDTLGHAAGDDLICQTANRLRESVRAQDTVARLGGDEFAIIVPGPIDKNLIERLATRILTSLNTPFSLGDEQINTSGSIGIATTGNRVDMDFEALVHEADVAMYRAKTSGRNKYESFSGEFMALENEDNPVSAELNEKIDIRQLELLFQAQIEIQSAKVVGVEAFVRWNHPRLGKLLPGAFMAAAIEQGSIVFLDKWVIENSLKQLAQWRAVGILDLNMSINISNATLSDAEIFKFFEATALKLSIPFERISFEISSQAFESNDSKTLANIDGFRSLGAKITVDDFGLHSKIYNTERSYGIDALKIDPDSIKESLLSEELNEDSETKVAAIIQMAKQLGTKMIGQKIETDSQLTTLRDLGCTVVQGYLFSPPVKPREILLLARNSY